MEQTDMTILKAHDSVNRGSNKQQTKIIIYELQKE